MYHKITITWQPFLSDWQIVNNVILFIAADLSTMSPNQFCWCLESLTGKPPTQILPYFSSNARRFKTKLTASRGDIPLKTPMIEQRKLCCLLRGKDVKALQRGMKVHLVGEILGRSGHVAEWGTQAVAEYWTNCAAARDGLLRWQFLYVSNSLKMDS